MESLGASIFLYNGPDHSFYKLEITALYFDLGVSSLVFQTILLWKGYGLSILEGVQECHSISLQSKVIFASSTYGGFLLREILKSMGFNTNMI